MFTIIQKFQAAKSYSIKSFLESIMSLFSQIILDCVAGLHF